MNDEYDEGAEGEGSMAEGKEGEKRWDKYIGKLEISRIRYRYGIQRGKREIKGDLLKGDMSQLRRS